MPSNPSNAPFKQSSQRKTRNRAGRKCCAFSSAAPRTRTAFSSAGVRPGEGNHFQLDGELTIKGVTHAVEFELEFDGVSPDPWGGTRAGFSAEAEINRKDWGLEWNVALETGGVLVGEKIKVQLEIQLVKAA